MSTPGGATSLLTLMTSSIEFAQQLGMKQAWFQTDPRRPYRSHYDVTEALRRQAIALGAVPVTWRDIGRMMRVRREGMLLDDRLPTARS